MNEIDSVIPSVRTYDSEASEDVLVADAKAGSLDAFGKLIERCQAKVFRVAQTFARSREDAEEIMQDALVKAFKNLSKFRGDSRFYTWLVRITINEGLMKARARRPLVFSIDAPTATEERNLPREIEDWAPTPEQRYSQQELRNILSKTIRKLAPRYRMVVHLREIEGLSTPQIGRALDLSDTAVKSRLRRARLQMRYSLHTYLRPTVSGRSSRWFFALNSASQTAAMSQFALQQ